MWKIHKSNIEENIIVWLLLTFKFTAQVITLDFISLNKQELELSSNSL